MPYIYLTVAGLIMLRFFMRSERPARSALKSMLSGAAALLAAHYLGVYAGIALQINMFTTIAALLLGIPGVAAMVLVKLLAA